MSWNPRPRSRCSAGSLDGVRQALHPHRELAAARPVGVLDGVDDGLADRDLQAEQGYIVEPDAGREALERPSCVADGPSPWHDNQYPFDQACRVEAIALASRFGQIELFQGYFFARPAFEALPPAGLESLTAG